MKAEGTLAGLRNWADSLCAIISLLAISLYAAPAGPEPQIPAGGRAPGKFPNTSVSSINVLVRGGTTFDSKVEVVGIEGQGPIPWSINRYNRGDFALRLSPGDAAAALSNLGQGFIEFAEASPGLAANQAWRPQPQFGVIIPNGAPEWAD